MLRKYSSIQYFFYIICASILKLSGNMIVYNELHGMNIIYCHSSIEVYVPILHQMLLLWSNTCELFEQDFFRFNKYLYYNCPRCMPVYIHMYASLRYRNMILHYYMANCSRNPVLNQMKFHDCSTSEYVFACHILKCSHSLFFT